MTTMMMTMMIALLRTLIAPAVIKNQRLSSLRTSQWRSQSKVRPKFAKGASWHSAKATNSWAKRWPTWSTNWQISANRSQALRQRCLLPSPKSCKSRSSSLCSSSNLNNSLLQASYPNAAIRNGKNLCSRYSMQVHLPSIQELAHLSHT